MVCRVVCSERRNAPIGMTSQAHAASLLYVHPHPTAARRAATLASSGCEMHMGARISLRPLQRRFKARKKPEGYTSTPTGLKRLKTQNTAFHGNGNGKGTPSGVPQPIHKRKLVLVKEEFDASSFGGDEGDRTPDLLTASQALSQLSYAPVTMRYYRGMSLGMQEGILGLLLVPIKPSRGVTLLVKVGDCRSLVDDYCGRSSYDVADACVG